jgi:hypothetical protein
LDRRAQWCRFLKLISHLLSNLKIQISSAHEGHPLAHGLLVDSFPEVSQQFPHVLLVGEALDGVVLMVVIVLEVVELVDGEFEHIVEHAGDEHPED